MAAIHEFNGPGTYSQNFNSLASSGTGAWADDNTSTLGGSWFGSAYWGGVVSPYQAGNGSSATGALWSFGSTGSSDRALGSINSNGDSAFREIAYGVEFYNNTGTTISQITVSYTGEQWRGSGAPAQTLDFAYKISPVVITDIQPHSNDGSDGWIAVNALDFTSPITGGSAMALDGNASGNRTIRNAAFTINLAAGSYLMLRWRDVDSLAQQEHGLAIDDLFVTVPEPWLPAALVGLGLVGYAAWRRLSQRRVFKCQAALPAHERVP